MTVAAAAVAVAAAAAVAVAMVVPEVAVEVGLTMVAPASSVRGRPVRETSWVVRVALAINGLAFWEKMGSDGIRASSGQTDGTM